MSEHYFAQWAHLVRLEWGRDGARRAAQRGDILVIVDVLRFSTAVVAILCKEGTVMPCAWEQNPEALANQFQAEVASSRLDTPQKSRYSLSPRSYESLEAGSRIILPSPNGATCSRLGAEVPYLFAGALVNARTVSQVVRRIIHTTHLSVTVVACGERWGEPGEDGALRFALEDYLGAGAILSHLDLEMSPEAEVCARAFQSMEGNITNLLNHCGSGVELKMRNAWEDVIFASRCDTCSIAPVLRNGWFVPWRDEFLPSP